jgi:hypothetical protein
MEIMTREIVTPRQCTLGIGIPTSESDFAAAVKRSSAGFASMYVGGWPQYSNEVVRDLASLMNTAERRGIRLRRTVTRRTLSDLFADPLRPVVFIVGHWDKDVWAIELSDGLVPIHDFVAAVPDSFRGIIDFCACDPEPLMAVLRRDRTRCVVRHTSRDSTPYVWTAFYSVLIGVLASESRTYLQAVEEVVEAFTK